MSERRMTIVCRSAADLAPLMIVFSLMIVQTLSEQPPPVEPASRSR